MGFQNSRSLEGSWALQWQKRRSTSHLVMRYNSYTDDQRQRVLSTAREGGNWAQVALHNGIAYQTAWRWVNRARTTNVWTPSVGQRGGPRRVKITPEHVEYMVTLLEDKCLLTLYDLVDELKVKYALDLEDMPVGS
ncbi:hypothetical protein F443_03838 [Phytophthora nicotianae P1569]|uniref:Uncharacterized protein n=1 Tax=Phytophthora nicotianae P1569 TaxID=1317065 RepID=V9FN64_PHYNI|nr:hypothetical protein F443_04292 [Phytophthora nicotianae P1569]ETI53170.1 hypothetical protein F443_03838 [Phytophthora nicotianae P1569]